MNANLPPSSSPFWGALNEARIAAGGNQAEMCGTSLLEALEAFLIALEDDSLSEAAIDAHQVEILLDSYETRGACIILHGSDADSLLWGFVDWLVVHGRGAVLAFLEDPESLISLSPKRFVIFDSVLDMISSAAEDRGREGGCNVASVLSSRPSC